MWTVLIGFLVTLWIISLSIWLLWRWKPPGNEVHRPIRYPPNHKP